jgi:hypothetical protein
VVLDDLQVMWAESIGVGVLRCGFNTVITHSVTEKESSTATWPCPGEAGTNGRDWRECGGMC